MEKGWSYIEFNGEMFRGHPNHMPQVKVNGEWEELKLGEAGPPIHVDIYQPRIAIY